MFSPNNQEGARDEVKAILQIHSEYWNTKYLGLSVHVRKSKKKAFAYIKGSMAGKYMDGRRDSSQKRERRPW